MYKYRLVVFVSLIASFVAAWGQDVNVDLTGGLLGASDGLYQIIAQSKAQKLLSNVEVKKIVKSSEGFFFLTSNGIIFSKDLITFENRNTGIPVKTLKTFNNEQKGFFKEVQDLKDLEIDPYNNSILITCTKDMVFLTKNSGLSWEAIKSPAPQPGMKAVAVTSVPELIIFASHSIKGPYSKTAKGSWLSISGDLFKYDSQTNFDEISDIVVQSHADGPRVWASNSFVPRIYKYNFNTGRFNIQYKAESDFSYIDSLVANNDNVLFLSNSGVMNLDSYRGSVSDARPETNMILNAASMLGSQLESMYIPASNTRQEFSASELWLVNFKNEKPYTSLASNRNGIYLQTGFVGSAESLQKYDNLLTHRGLDTIVIDLKDDYGRLRFTPKDPLITALGRTFKPIDIESFTSEMKAKGRYLIARIVVFKDQHLYKYADGKYAVWDNSTKRPWQGYVLQKKEVPVNPDAAKTNTEQDPKKPATETITERKYYDEYWVDPYCEKVWEYNVAIAKEILSRGFDEVQFDYIRFPTDGVNIGDARYRYKDEGMDMESALMSFLNYARQNIAAPISVDIYGANGWYRSGVRTGQDVELMARFVDIICPMFYPSHFEQDFMAHAPAIQRPYRIYKIGTLRTSYIARRKIIVRPYVQAFYIGVSYDKKFYSPAYVALEVDGVRDATNDGLLYWNNSGRYDDIPVMKKP